MILAAAHEPDNPRSKLHSGSEEIRKSPGWTWKQNLYLRVWPMQVTGSRGLGLALALDHEQAHSIAQELQALGLVKITECRDDWEGWEWQNPPFTYRRAAPMPERPKPATVSYTSLLLTTAYRASLTVGSREHSPARVAESGRSAFRITEDRFANGGSLGRGSLLLAWEAEERGMLGQPVKVADLALWTGAPVRTVSRWLAALEAEDQASHHGRSWTLNFQPSWTNDMYDLILEAVDKAKTREEKLAIAHLLDLPHDPERIHRARVLRYAKERRQVDEWVGDYQPPPTEIRPGSPFRRYKIEAEPEPARPLTMADFMPRKNAP